MKKLMIAMTAVALAVSAQAATALIAQLKTVPEGASELTDDEVSYYSCFVLSGTKMADAMGVKSIGATEVDAVVDFLNADYTVNMAKIMATKPVDMILSAKLYSGALDFRNSSLTTYNNRFGIVLYDEGEGVSAYRVFNFNNNSSINDWAGTSSAGEWSSWQAVPEPTSGLLLLLGVAGLALRRKQK